MIDKYYRKEAVGYENKGKIKEHRKKVARLIYLNLWCVGLRVSEVCSLKGNAYSFDGTDRHYSDRRDMYAYVTDSDRRRYHGREILHGHTCDAVLGITGLYRT